MSKRWFVHVCVHQRFCLCWLRNSTFKVCCPQQHLCSPSCLCCQGCARASGPAPAGTHLTPVCSYGYQRQLIIHLSSPESSSLIPFNEESYASKKGEEGKENGEQISRNNIQKNCYLAKEMCDTQHTKRYYFLKEGWSWISCTEFCRRLNANNQIRCGYMRWEDEVGKLLARLNKEDSSKVISSIKEKDGLMKTYTHRNKSSI